MKRLALIAFALAALTGAAKADIFEPLGGGSFQGDVPIYEAASPIGPAVNITMLAYTGFNAVQIAPETLPHPLAEIEPGAFHMSDGSFYTALNGGLLLVVKAPGPMPAFTMTPFTDQLGQKGFVRKAGGEAFAYCLYTPRPNYVYCSYTYKARP